jgi:hypothetical protein
MSFISKCLCEFYLIFLKKIKVVMRGLVVNLVKKIRDKKSQARAPLNKFHHFTARIKKNFLLKHEVFAFEPDIL